MQPNLGDTQLILKTAREYGCSPEQSAYILATTYHETAGTMLPVRETLAKTTDQAIQRLEKSFKAGKLSWVKTAYWRKDKEGKSWLGRGYVQLTWKRNYIRLGSRLGLDLVSDPDAVMRPAIAVKILVYGMMEGLFTGHSLPDFIDNGKYDWVNARRVVNGTDRAELIAGYVPLVYLTIAQNYYRTEKKEKSVFAKLLEIIKGWFK